MDAVLQEQFKRVEDALGTLVESIAAYNPSTSAAAHLVAADDELGRGLDQLAQHQANYTRIQSLRAEADAQEEEFKSKLSALATLRHELHETPATAFPEDSRPVPLDELLQYAKNISKFTVPPTYRERVPGTETEEEEGRSSGAPSNGLNTPAHTTGGPASGQEPPRESTQADHEGENEPPKEVTEKEAEWLRKLNASQMAWFPWPDNDKIRRGNLFQIQIAKDSGKDPNTENLRNPGVELESLQNFRRLEAEKAERQQAQQVPQRQEAEEERPAQPQQPSHGPVEPVRPAQQQFKAFEQYDDDDDD